MTLDWPLILTYHHVTLTRTSRYVVSTARLSGLLDRMLGTGFSAITLEEALATGPSGSNNAAPKTFTITFDDALASFGELAMPVLAERGLIRFTTLFVPTALVGKTNAWTEEPTPLQRLMPWSEVSEAIMDWDEIANVAEQGVSVQSHGAGHLAMNKLTYEEALADATASRDALVAHGYQPKYFCLPYGWHSPEVKRAIADAGFEAALSVKRGGSDRYDVRRVPIYGTDHALTTRLKLSGRYFDAFYAAARLAGKTGYR